MQVNSKSTYLSKLITHTVNITTNVSYNAPRVYEETQFIGYIASNTPSRYAMRRYHTLINVENIIVYNNHIVFYKHGEEWLLSKEVCDASKGVRSKIMSLGRALNAKILPDLDRYTLRGFIDVKTSEIEEVKNIYKEHWKLVING